MPHRLRYTGGQAAQVADALIECHGALVLLARLAVALEVAQHLRQVVARGGLAARVVDRAVGG